MPSENSGKRRLMRIVLPAVLALPPPAPASPRLQCELAEGGETRQVEVAPAADPYHARAVDLNGHFRFKAVVVGSESQVDYVKLYAYYRSGKRPVLVQEARYLRPVAGSDPSPDALTGTQSLYSPVLGYELQYRCALREVAP